LCRIRVCFGTFKRKGYDAGQLERLDWKAYKETQYNKLAEIIRESLDMEYIYQILGKGTRMP
jgi:adenosylcobyric acid synthase (glutamine-hydrolysing) (EC 6.3.5.10)